jgi:hypothetical protein
MSEPAVALTDYILAIESAIFAILLHRRRPSALQFWLTVYFASVCAASLFGGTVHGFFSHLQSSTRQTLWSQALWSATLLAIGVTALATWFMVAALLSSRRLSVLVRMAAALQVAAYTICVLFITTSFWTAIAVNIPAVVFLLTTVAHKYSVERQRPLLLMIASLALSLFAAALQQLRVGLHPIHFDHNAVYHVIQAIALYLLYRGGDGLLDIENLQARGEAEPTIS